MHEYDLILTLTAGLGGALFFGYITQRLGLSPIVGYLLAGMLVGPNTPGNRDRRGHRRTARGDRRHPADVRRRPAVPPRGAAGGARRGACRARSCSARSRSRSARGWPPRSAGVRRGSIVFGIALAVASTVVVVRVLSDHNALHTPAGHIAVGWLVVEDIFTVLAIVLLPALVRQRRSRSAGLDGDRVDRAEGDGAGRSSPRSSARA